VNRAGKCWCSEVCADAPKPDPPFDQAARTEFGRAWSIMRFRMVTPMATSTCWPGGVRAWSWPP